MSLSRYIQIVLVKFLFKTLIKIAFLVFKEIIREWDLDGDGKVSYKEFENALKS